MSLMNQQSIVMGYCWSDSCKLMAQDLLNDWVRKQAALASANCTSSSVGPGFDEHFFSPQRWQNRSDHRSLFRRINTPGAAWRIPGAYNSLPPSSNNSSTELAHPWKSLDLSSCEALKSGSPSGRWSKDVGSGRSCDRDLPGLLWCGKKLCESPFERDKC